MELQLALDMIGLEEAIEMVAELRDLIDIIEIGTPFVICEGLRAVREMRKVFPEKRILADLKIMDAGYHEAKSAFLAGADIVTVLGASNDRTISEAVRAAKEENKEIMVDMIDVSALAERTKEIDALGVDYVCVHTAFDLQHTGENPLLDLEKLNAVLIHAKAAVAGGIGLDTLPAILKERPEIIVVGGSISNQKDKRATASLIYEQIKREG